ncbi:hypothetical protein F5Y04DRAFT_281454 [Hypomontagnella monticulosa]|nr:hypothetical protein F5Y04DRAFT_281454 [Hypomontagnella monticulosa]
MKVLPKGSLKLFKKLLPKRSDPSNTATATTSRDIQDDNDDNISPKSKKQQQQSTPEPPEECPICHDPVGIANPEGIVESWTALHCGHKFGTHCIQTWLQESINRDVHVNPSCPICRTTAKHPCGHLVSPPPFPSLALDWQLPRSPPPAPVPIRRRLTRRPGHPLRPPPAPQQPRRKAQTVGECRTCAEAAEFEARLQRRMRERGRQDTGSSDATTSTASNVAVAGDRRSSAAATIKAMIPGLKRSSVVHTVRASPVVEEVEQRTVSRYAQHRDPRPIVGVPCVAPQYAPRQMPRRLTPPPGYSRRLSI